MGYYRDSLVALRVLRRCAPNDPSLVSSRFGGLTPTEFEDRIQEMRNRLDDQVELSLCAAYEAQLRRDYLARTALKTKDKASQAPRKLFKTHGEAVPLDSLLDCWKQTAAGFAKIVGEFRQTMKLRHWLAHGQYWNQKSGLANPTPEEVFRRGEALSAWLRQFGFPMVA